MRALTLTQPYAGLVASGLKLVENRPRPMIKREDFGKPFAIHGSREIDDDVFETIARIAPELRTMGIDRSPKQEELWYRLSRIKSAVIAVATIDAVVEGSPRGTAGFIADDQRRWFFGPIGYVLRDVHALAKPVPCRGWQGFWRLDAETEAKVLAQIDGGTP